MAWASLAVAAVGAGTAIYSAKQSEKNTNNLVTAQRRIVDNIKYEPIDIDRLKAEATQQAISNATQSLALERQLQPDAAATRADISRTNGEVARTKFKLAQQVNADLDLGGNLSPDTINRVETAGRVIGGRSGIGSPSTVPLTAGLLGIESINLLNSRRNAANALLPSPNPGDLPIAGLDPGALASLEVAQNAAQNQFNLEKAGAESNLNQGIAAARSSQIGGQVGQISSLANLLGKGIGAYGTMNNNKAVGDFL